MSESIATNNNELSLFLDFEAEELQKKLRCSMANFAQLKFVKLVQSRCVQEP